VLRWLHSPSWLLQAECFRNLLVDAAGRKIVPSIRLPASAPQPGYQHVECVTPKYHVLVSHEFRMLYRILVVSVVFIIANQEVLRLLDL